MATLIYITSESLTGVTNLQNWPIFQSLSKGPFLSKLEYSCFMVIGDLHETINISLSERNMALSTGYAKLSYKKVIFQEYFYCISFIFYFYPINTLWLMSSKTFQKIAGL